MKLRYIVFAVVMLFPLLASAQEQLLVLGDWTETSQYLNDLIAADTAANGWVPNRVYVLKRDGIYLWKATFAVRLGCTLRIRSDYNTNATYKPTIYLYPTGTGTNPWNPPGNMVQLTGGDLSLKNLMISGYYEPVDTNLNNLQGAMVQVTSAGTGSSIYIDSCILSNSNGNHVRTDGAPKVVKVTNSIFANMGFLGKSNLGAGKGIDFRNVSVDSAIIENCTFVNWQDRVIRHYTSTAEIKYLRFNRNTLVNGMSYHGLLSLGRVGKNMYITNNLLIDPFALGNDTDATRQAEFNDSGEKDAWGNPRMTWVISVPNDTTVWTVANNYYAISDSGQAFFNQFAAAGVTGEGSPLTWHINSRLGADSVNAFKKVVIKPNKVPALMTTMMRWYRDPNGGNKTKSTTYFIKDANGKWIYDFDRRKLEYFHDTLDCSFRSSVDLTNIGSSQWSFLGIITAVDQQELAPHQFALEQNYPNPFNPSTEFKYTVGAVGKVSIRVYDILGREVATLVNEVKQPGTYTATWNATGFASGVYFYKMQANDFSSIKKMVLMK